MKNYITSEKALDLLRHGEVVALPTETVYGLGADIRFEKALKSIFQIKNRPFFDPLIVHVSDLKSALKYVQGFDPVSEALAKNFWPGPLTLVLPKNPKTVHDFITAGESTVALRCPSHPLFLDILKNLKSAVAAPSANPFKKTSPTSAEHVQKYFKDLPILDGGPCEIGLESTIVKVSTDHQSIELLRPGKITKDDLDQFLKDNNINFRTIENFNSHGPGSMKEHYQPHAPLYLFISRSSNLEDLKKFTSPTTIELPNDPILFARLIYKSLIESSVHHDALVLNWQNKKNHPLWNVILNRLEKAATQII